MAQNDNTNVNLGRGKRRKLKNSQYFNEEIVNAIMTEMDTNSEKNIGEDDYDTGQRKTLKKSCYKFTT